MHSEDWNFADIWDIAAAELPDRPCQIQGKRRFSWKVFERRSSGLARALLSAGLQEQSKFSQYLYNCPEYLESVFAAFKAGLVPVNTNYRYEDRELLYLWDNSDTEAIVFHGVFSERLHRLRKELGRVKLFIWVDDGSGDRPDWAVDYEELVASVPEGDHGLAPWGRSGDHLYMLYTGGTTGMPKGVMWRQDDLCRVFALSTGGDPSTPDPEVIAKRLRSSAETKGLPACPLMHGTGAITAFQILNLGGCIVTLESRHFDPEELLDTVEREKVNSVSIVGDAFAKPILRALDANPGRWDLSSLRMMISSGVMWSQQTKEGLLKHNPGMMLVDAFSSSEALGMGQSVSAGGQTSTTAKFRLGDRARVIKEDGTDVVAGSGEVGMVALKGPNPIGYYKDPEKTARTFKEIDGERYVIPGDFATVEADGTIKLLGRGSVCINTGGEKVFPEEVEEVLKEYPGVRDAVAVGVPDERFGEAVTAVVELEPGAEVDADELITHAKSRIASYKAPKHIVFIDSVGRSPSGKVDYAAMKATAEAEVAKEPLSRT
jgi:acyl-CoA synthetase (AMP-forming)/AMP-acid ligase II